MPFDCELRAEHLRQRFGASPEQWNDWRWQLSRRPDTPEALAELLPLSASELEGIRRAGERYRWGVTPYALSLIDPEDPSCPLKAQLLPCERELTDSLGEADPLRERDHSPVPDLIRVYPDRVALCLTSLCPVYCRHCFRKRRTLESVPADAFERALDYIARHPEIRDVLVTGGDPLMLPDEVLLTRLERLKAIPHVEMLRLGTRVPSMLPMRITEDLARALALFHPLFVNVQFNHPRELTVASRKALALLADHGIPLGNQSVLLRGINDRLDTHRELLHVLLKARVRPYYLFHPHLVEGTEHFRLPIEVGLDLVESLEGYTSGLAVPAYALDTPFGKVRLSRGRIIDRNDDSVTVRTFDGTPWTEPNPKE